MSKIRYNSLINGLPDAGIIYPICRAVKTGVLTATPAHHRILASFALYLYATISYMEEELTEGELLAVNGLAGRPFRLLV